MKSINVEGRIFFLWRVEFFKMGKRDFTFIREMRVVTIASIVSQFRQTMMTRRALEALGLLRTPPCRNARWPKSPNSRSNKQTTSGLVVHFWVHKLDMDHQGNRNVLRITYKNYLLQILSLCHEPMYKKNVYSHA